jgi:hypothetical protein
MTQPPPSPGGQPGPAGPSEPPEPSGAAEPSAAAGPAGLAGHAEPEGAFPGHPEPEPAPEPEPPLPIPPPEPIPHPEPPHAAADDATAVREPVDASAVHTTAVPAAGDATAVHAAGAATGVDFIDAPPQAGTTAFPPVGAYPGEPGHPDPEPHTVWQQPPPAGPWHARHERPGEWQHAPPEHLAYVHSPPAEVEDPTRVAPVPAAGRKALTPDAEATMRRRRAGLWASVALTVTLLVCGGGAASAYVLFRNADVGGAPDPATAVNRFMTAVYTEQDASAADDLVCREARDAEALSARVEEIRGYANEYDGPSFRWSDPAVAGRTEERATVSVDLTLTTDDEKTSQQRLTFTTVRKTNWLVCEITG